MSKRKKGYLPPGSRVKIAANVGIRGPPSNGAKMAWVVGLTKTCSLICAMTVGLHF